MSIALKTPHFSSSCHLRETRKERPYSHRQWINEAIAKICAEAKRGGETSLIRLDLPFDNVDVYLKDESTHPSGSLKHRLAKSLFLWGLSSGKIGPETTIIECSSGSTAISEAYFSKLLGLPFISFVPDHTAAKKTSLIEFYGGQCKLVPAQMIHEAAIDVARSTNGHFMDQFTYAERATDWRAEDNIAASIFRQMESERHPVPSWIVVGAGTGGTSTTIGRYLSYVRPDCNTKLCVVDPENSVLYDYYTSRDINLKVSQSSRIEGIGRPRVEPSFFPELVDRMYKVPDATSIAAMLYLENLTGRRFGASTGVNLVGAVELARELEAKGEKASIVSLACDNGERYSETYYNDQWLIKNNLLPQEKFNV
ncbi:Pyridoxal-5'-phosphate-dependent protein beta subunit [Hirschia baltica ATCC 49814]|uniref:Pyridoxal-5'-phosphate-dependent protein beta subunit n=1 Tax=Hirschia baltica (strain ATCC 49814 / DSM 5838 / IFAM 1418) TaxID=582402 RepID=C6XPP0_HIRBI|nr:PLP-dependent cysteine synthase family protein [Hirschia baltica]ACT60305.1 Pyridoxal-5'-phosphate-dependent protein beta subunit [Hirschia baltica ATCC 49814]